MKFAEDEKPSRKANKTDLVRFAKYFRPVIGIFLLDSLFALIIALIAVATPFITQMITRSAINTDYYWMVVGIGILVSMFAVNLLCTFVITYWGHIMGVKMEIQMRKEAVEKMHKLKMSHYDKTPIGSFISRIVSDLKDIPEFAHHGPEDFIVAVVTATGGLTYAYLQSWITGVMLTIIFIIGMLVVYIIRIKWREIWETLREDNSILSTSIGQQVESIAEIKSYASEKDEQRKFNNFQDRYFKTNRKFYRFEGFFSSTNLIVMTATTFSTLFAGSFMVYYGIIDMSQLIGLTSAAAIINQPIQKFVNVYTMIARGSSSVVRFYEFMDLPEEENKGIDIASDFQGRIEFKNVTFSYIDDEGKRNYVLNKFNLIIKKGEKIALVGETGIGKSTILKLILRFYDIQEGDILIDGKSIYSYELHSLRKRLGYIQQQATIFQDTITNNIKYGKLDATTDEFEFASSRAAVNEFIEKLINGYDTIAGPAGAQLSGGQKQRVSIARSFLKDSSIMLLDEATSALDNTTEKKIKDAIETLTKDKTTLIVAHRLSTIKNVDRIVVLGKGGLILEQGSFKELIDSKGALYELNNQ